MIKLTKLTKAHRAVLKSRDVDGPPVSPANPISDAAPMASDFDGGKDRTPANAAGRHQPLSGVGAGHSSLGAEHGSHGPCHGVSHLAADAGPDGSAPAVFLGERTRQQCPFPLWDDEAKPGDQGYGQVCGAPVGEGAYCAEHGKLCGGRKADKARADRIVRATIAGARRAKVA